MKKHLLTLVLAFLSIQIQANDKINFHVLDVKAGISDHYIQDILHDKYGFMWFATRNGLNRYDGYHFKHYTTIQFGAYDNNVEWISEDASGSIWIKTPVNYCYYNREKDELENTIQHLLTPLGIDGTVKQLFIDEDRNLWCTIGNTLYYYRFSTGILSHIPLPGNVEVVDLTCRQSNAYLLLSDGNITTIDWVSSAIRKVTHIDRYSGFLPHIYIDMEQKLWLYATHGYDIRCYSTQERKWIAFPGQAELDNDRCNITTVTDDGKGNIWIGTDNKGIIVSHFSQNTFTQIYKEAEKMFTLPTNHVTCIFKDERDGMWIGTGKQGVSYSGLNNIIFENNRCPQQEDVSCLFEDGEDNLWLGFDGEGIARYNKKKNNYTYFKSKDKTIPSNLIVCSFLDSKERLWWGSFGGGAFYYEDGKFILPDYQSDESEKTEAPHYIRRIVEDADGNMWFATYTQGLYRLNTQGELKSFTMANSALLTNYIADLSCVDGHTVYIATSSGVYCMDTATLQLVQLKRSDSDEEIIQDNFANCIYQDSRGYIWIGGRKGINVYDKSRNFLTHLTTAEGLSHPYIRAIVEDCHHNMWITTDHGITHIILTAHQSSEETKFRCYPYFEEDGMVNFTFNNFSIICNRHNEILAGGAGGYIRIRSDLSDFYHYDHRVVFTELYLANRCVNAGQPVPDGRILLKKNIQLLDEITMDYSDSNFALEVSAMDYGNLHKLIYLYRLDRKEEWIRLEGNRIYFNKLAPGTYHLEVKVNESQDYENNQIAVLTIHVQPPFWLSLPAYILYVLLVISFITLFIIRIKRKHFRLLELQKRDMEIAQQHEMDEAKLRFFTNISHDLRTPLSLIITPLEKILGSEMAAGVKEELTLMHRNAVTLLNVVNQLLDLRKLDNEKAQLNASHGDLAEFVKEVCQSFESFAQRQHISLQLVLKSPYIEADFDRNKMQRIMLNLLSNAFKYNVENGSVTVTVERISDKNEEAVRIQIADTGIGIRDENKSKIFDRFFQEEHTSTAYVGSGIGMHIVKEYVSLHKGTIQVQDNLPRGTVFTLTLPVRNCQQHCMEESSETSAFTTEVKNEQIPILIVEDNDDFRHFLFNCLKEHFQVFDAEDGKQAIKVLEQHDIKLVISDVRMPIMNGLELCNKIKGDIHYSHIPVILLTARTAEEHILEGLREGADDYLAKPFNLDILLLRINKLLEWADNNHKKFGIVDISPSEITVSTLDEQLITRAIQVVEANMDNSEFSVEGLSTEVGMSRGHLYKKLMTITGKSPVEFIRILRIKRGKQLLEQSQESVSQIAYKIGLSPKLFSKYFKEEFGVLPSNYKREENK